jgi:hypothetical protein
MPHSIPLIRRFKTAGSTDGPAHVFYNNNYVLERSVDQHPVVYLLPTFSANTGTYDFYDSTPQSVFVIYTRPSLAYTFTGNTHVFTSDTRFVGIVNDIYKIHNEDILAYRENGDQAAWQRVANAMMTPIVSYSASTTAVTSAYTFSLLPEQFVKPSDGYTEEIFEDRAEYFLNMRFVFTDTGSTTSFSSMTGSTSAITATTLTFNSIDVNGNIVTKPYSSTTTVISNDVRSTISNGDWSGLTVYGFFFTCFQPPSKPIVQFPFVATAATENTTFTPTFNFSNVEDGDNFVLEVTYDMSDTGFTNVNTFSGVTQYFREKTSNSLEETVDKSNTIDVVGFERTATLKTRRINAPIRPSSSFLYRIGNVKTVKNIFEVEQKIINYSNYYSGVTGSRETMRLYVDSKTSDQPVIPSTATGSVGNGTLPVAKQPK